MPLQFEGLFQGSFSFEDNNDEIASTGLWLPAVPAFADVEARFAALSAVLTPLSNARLKQAFYSRLAREVPELAAPVPESEVERKLELVFGTANPRVTFTQEIPSPVFSLETRGTNNVDPANPLLAAYVDEVLTGVFGPANGAVTYFGQQLNKLISARIVHRTRRAKSA